jgi:hypothetical protein
VSVAGPPGNLNREAGVKFGCRRFDAYAVEIGGVLGGNQGSDTSYCGESIGDFAVDGRQLSDFLGESGAQLGFNVAEETTSFLMCSCQTLLGGGSFISIT